MSALDFAPPLRELRIGHAPSVPAILGVPAHAQGLVIFAHGSGSGRLSPRNNNVPLDSARQAWPLFCSIC
jgi:putative phosphoribosyl transferase